MKKVLIAIFIIALCCIPIISHALPVEYSLEVDDYGELLIDGTSVALYDNIAAAGGVWTGILDLSPGWHDIDIIYKNRTGSNALILHQRDFDDMSAPVVPLEYLRSTDSSGNIINGLTADYYNLDGSHVITIYGEGPIDHGARWNDTHTQLLTYYQGVWPDPWAGMYDGWSHFEERLSGQIFVPSSVPEPATMFLFGSLLVGFLGLGNKKKFSV